MSIATISMTSTTNTSSKTQTKCSYCHNSGHNITSCPEDIDMDKLLDSNVEPNFHNLSLKTLKKIASLTGLRTGLSKSQYVNTFKRTWRMRNEERNKQSTAIATTKAIATTAKAKAVTSMLDEQTECPICMDELGVTDNCTTKCGHKFCSSCFVKSVMRKNNCPMCRAHLINDDEYYWPIERYLGESYSENIATRNHSPTQIIPDQLMPHQFMPSTYQYQHQHQDQSQQDISITYSTTFDPNIDLSSIANNISVTDIEFMNIVDVSGNNGPIDLTVDMDDIFGPDSDDGGSDDSDIPSLIDELFPEEE
jgi:hypothetical protein